MSSSLPSRSRSPLSPTSLSAFSSGWEALKTLCGQAFGAGQIHMQRSWIILFGTCFTLLPMYVYATPLLKLLGQEQDIAEIAGRFTLLVIPQMFSLSINFQTQKFLQAQSKVGFLAWIGFIALLVHIGMLFAYNISGWGDIDIAGSLHHRAVKGWLERAVLVGFQGDLGIPEALDRFSHHDLFGGLVHESRGIWIGMILGTVLQTLIVVYMIYKTNRNKEVEEAKERMKKQ